MYRCACVCVYSVCLVVGGVVWCVYVLALTYV